MSDLIIFGAGDIARMAHFYFERDSEHRVVAFAVDKEFRTRDTLNGLAVVEFDQISRLFPPNKFKMFVALSYVKMNRVRTQIYKQVKGMGYELVSYISSRCSFLTEIPVGDNCFILEDNTVQPFVTIGNNVTLWSGNHIGHDSVIEDNCFLASHIVVSGHCTIGNGCFLGVNATLHDGITLAPESLIGAGAIVTRNTIEKGVYLPSRSMLADKFSDEIEL